MTDVMIHAAGASSKQVIFECHHHDVDAVDLVIAVSGIPEYCTIFHFPPFVCPPYVTGVTSQPFLII